METYLFLQDMAQMLQKSGDVPTEQELLNAYNNGGENEAIASLFVTHYKLFRRVANRFFQIPVEDRDSLILLAVHKSLSTYDLDMVGKVSIQQYTSTNIYNSLSNETDKLNTQLRVVTKMTCGFDDLGDVDLDKISRIAEEDTYVYSDLYELVKSVKLSEKEEKICMLILQTPFVMTRSELARAIGVTRAGMTHIMNGLKLKFAPIYDLSI